MSLMKKDNETVRHFALRVQQLVKKGWCNESASTINLKNNEIFTKGLPKKLKDFAHRRQVKHVSTLLEPSIPFHTLVRHVDSEDNEKIRTNDLTLEINKVSIENDKNNKESDHDRVMVTQTGDTNNKSKPAYQKFCSYCHKNNHGISNCYQKQRDEEYQKYKNQRSRTPQQSFVQYFRSKPSNSQEYKNESKNDFSYRDNDCNRYNHSYYNDRYRNNDRYRSNSRGYSQNNYRSNSRQRYLNRSPSSYPSRSRYDNHYQRRTPSRSPYRSPYRNNSNYRYSSRSRYRSCSQSQGNSFRQYNYPNRSPSRPRNYWSRPTTPSQNRQQNRINQVGVESTNNKDSTIFEIHTCQITEIADTLTPHSSFYPLHLHASEGKGIILPSKLEILFLLDTGASISVLNLPTFHVVAKQLNLDVLKNNENKRAKTLTVANQTEVPIIQYIPMTCFTELNHQNRSFNIEFAVANIKYNILGTPFFKKKIQNIDFQQYIMTYKEQYPNLPTKNTLLHIYRKRFSIYLIHLYY